MSFIGPDRLGFSTGWEAISNAEAWLRHRQWPAFDRGRYGHPGGSRASQTTTGKLPPVCGLARRRIAAIALSYKQRVR
jgi:hypothetical protein